MKITQIIRLVTVVLAMVLVFFIVTVSWSLNHLSGAFRTVEKYGSLRTQVTARIHMPINAYLATGDAALLSEIEANIRSMQVTARQDEVLPVNARGVFLELLESLGQALVGDLRAAGKMADPQILLVNNENQLAGEIDSLLGVVERSNTLDAADKLRYYKSMGQMLFTLQRLASTRQNYFVNQREAALNTIETYLRELAEHADRLSGYQPLGVASAGNSEDEMADLLGWNDGGGGTSGDAGREHLSEMVSLIKRYPKDLRNARSFIEQKIAGRNKTAERMLTLQQRLEQLGQTVTADYQQTERTLYAMLFVSWALIIAIGVAMVLLLRHIAAITNQTSDHVNKLASGDLHSSFVVSSTISEVAQLKNAIAQLKDYFKHLIGNIHRETATLDRCRQDVIEGSRQMERIVAEQQTLSVASAEQMNQLLSSFQEVARNAGETHHTTTSAREGIEDGADKMETSRAQVTALADVMDETAASLRHLQQDAKAIEGVLGVIRGFTEQTNLLALNAAIEAARAGEHGRGFAVVADEVRKLASHTASSADEISLLVEKLNAATGKTVGFMQRQQAAVARTVEAVDVVGRAFAAIRGAINDIHEKNALIAAAAEQQSAVAEEVAQGIRSGADAAGKSLQEAQSNKSSADALNRVGENLQALVSQFSLR